MIDTRNSYRAVPVENREYWEVEFRRWFSPLWREIKWANDIIDAKKIAEKHAAGDARETVHFGRLPTQSPASQEAQP